MGNIQGAAGGNAVLILAERGLCMVEVIIEEVGGIQFVVPQELPDRTMKIVTAGLGDYVYVRARGNAELGVRNLRLNIELLDRVRRWADGPNVGKNGIVQ